MDLLGNHDFFRKRNMGPQARRQFTRLLQGRLIPAIHLGGGFRVLGIEPLRGIDIDELHAHTADFLDGFLFFDNTSLALGVVGNPVVVQVGYVHADLECGNGDALDHSLEKNVLRLL